jgi:hypothetical protein
MGRNYNYFECLAYEEEEEEVTPPTVTPPTLTEMVKNVEDYKNNKITPMKNPIMAILAKQNPGLTEQEISEKLRHDTRRYCSILSTSSGKTLKELVEQDKEKRI